MNVQRIIYNKQTFRINILGILENFLSIDCSCKFSPNYFKNVVENHSTKIELSNIYFQFDSCREGLKTGVSHVDTSVSSNIKVNK